MNAFYISLLTMKSSFAFGTVYGGENFFFTMWGIWVLKDAEFYADFKNIDLPL
jgi:hypothetical protein